MGFFMGFFQYSAIACVLGGFFANRAVAQTTIFPPCDLALVLAVDVSGSVDAGEYRVQMVTQSWAQMNLIEDVQRFAARIATDQRQWFRYSTAIGEALEYSVALFDQVPECQKRVIDVSGDGPSNEGVEPRVVGAQMRAKGITVNALVIDANDDDLAA